MQYLANKASGTLNFIEQNFTPAPLYLKEALYVTNVRPILEYAFAWDPHMQNLIYKLGRIQNHTSRFVSGNYNFTSSITNIRNHLRRKLLSQKRKPASEICLCHF